MRNHAGTSAAAGLLLLASLAAPRAEGGDSLEYPVKAAFLLNFAKFTEWPDGTPQSDAPQVSICVLGPDPFGEVLDQVVAGRSAGGRPITVRRHRELAGSEDCHVAFVAELDAQRAAQAVAHLRGRPVLTVGEAPDFAREGGAIRFFVDGNRARFEVNRGAAEAAGLRLSSQLLGVARVLDARASRER